MENVYASYYWLLARNAADWWNRLSSAGGSLGDLIAHHHSFLRIRLSELANNVGASQQLLQIGQTAFQEKLRIITTPKQAIPNLATRNALVILMQALLLALGESAILNDEQAVFNYMLARERRFWHRRLIGYGVPEVFFRLFEVLVTIVTLRGGTQSQAETNGLLSDFKQHHTLDTSTIEAFRHVIQSTYGNNDILEPLQPDRLGDALQALHTNKEIIALASRRIEL